MSTRSWTATWSLALTPDAATATLTGSATITNDTAEDWNGVALSLLPHDLDSPPGPEPDRDLDRIPDDLDQCPDEAETYNGTDDEDGCPDQGHAHVANGPMLFDRIAFGPDASTLSRAARSSSQSVAAALRNNALLEKMASLFVVGHSTPRENSALARSRSQNVVEELVSAGIARSHLESVAKTDSDAADVTFEVHWSPKPAVRADAPFVPARTEVPARIVLHEPVHLARGRSLTVRVPSRTITAERIVYLRPAPAGMKASVVNALRLATQGEPLELGAIEITDGDRLSSRSFVPRLSRNDSFFVKLERAGALKVDVDVDTSRVRVRVRSIDRGLAIVEDSNILQTTFTLYARPPIPRRIFLGVPRRQGMTPEDLPRGAVIAADGYHLPLEIVPNGWSVLGFRERFVETRTVHLYELSPEEIDTYAAAENLPEPIAGTLRGVSAGRRSITLLEDESSEGRPRTADLLVRRKALDAVLRALQWRDAQ